MHHDPTRNVLYTGKTHTSSGGRNGTSRSSDGRLDIQLSSPGTAGSGTNPGAAACRWLVGLFYRCDRDRGWQMKVALPADLAIDAEVDLGTTGGAYFLQARLNVSLPELEHEVAQALVDAAHRTCPYSKATSGNINVVINLVLSQRFINPACPCLSGRQPFHISLNSTPGLSISTGAWNVPICPAGKRRFTLPDARFPREHTGCDGGRLARRDGYRRAAYADSARGLPGRHPGSRTPRDIISSG
ncbi:Ohr family peroxiredoxin [Cupriavidus basilensis]